jgi:hypothetical protein
MNIKIMDSKIGIRKKILKALKLLSKKGYRELSKANDIEFGEVSSAILHLSGVFINENNNFDIKSPCTKRIEISISICYDKHICRILKCEKINDCRYIIKILKILNSKP